MNAKELARMINDKHFFDLKKMQYKYSPESVTEMLEALREMSCAQLALKDFEEQPCVYLPAQSLIPTSIMKKLLAANTFKESFGLKAMEEEIDSTLQIENIQSNRDSVRKILQGFAPENEEENRILGMKKGLEFIGDPTNKITEENLHRLYMLSVGNFLERDDKLPKGSFYRNDTVYIVGDKPYHEGLSPKLLPNHMGELVQFANQKDDIPELAKACMLHFYIAYLHPYFDGNGRTARLVHLWYLVQQGFSSTLFYAYSKHINNSKSKYYNSFLNIEENYKISKLLDMTPFIRYFKENVYDKIDAASGDMPVPQIFTQAMRDGKITEKERDLWNFVLSVYGDGQFSTKQLEKDFGNAAYATIRSFVLKFEKLGLLTSQRFGNRVKYGVR
ncbi:Fic family protein [Desulfitobacterium sp.]|uniref:Fic family protein n=1 Tax=Desulfitobacterium sp. TaxID=49981 RepID=UPI002B215D16|nr:Fic family protein [Desulfitobacterium sp.]MEA4900326.1 Fic family protein [Desulfitobacterium sp.]